MWSWRKKSKAVPHPHGRYQSIWFYHGAMYVPCIVRTSVNGYFLEQEPVTRLQPSREAIRKVLEDATRSPDIVSAPSPLPFSPLSKVTGARSLEAFIAMR